MGMKFKRMFIRNIRKYTKANRRTMAITRHVRRSAVSAGRPGGLIREITWKGNIGRKAKNFRGVFTFLRKEKGFRSISNRVSFPHGEIRKISADIKSKKNCPWGS